jgi:hypothetical protein
MLRWVDNTYPDAVEDVAVREDPDVQVGLDNVVELALLLVPEEGVWHPHLEHQTGPEEHSTCGRKTLSATIHETGIEPGEHIGPGISNNMVVSITSTRK